MSTGACVGHVSPEALAGGPIGRLRDGDRVRIVIDRNTLEGSIDLVGDESGVYGPEWGFLAEAGPVSTVLAAGSAIKVFPKGQLI